MHKHFLYSFKANKVAQQFEHAGKISDSIINNTLSK